MRKRGQAMVESTIALIVVLLVFLALFNLADQIRVKFLVEHAAMTCARWRAVGYNDFMLKKVARLITMPAAGKCLTTAETGEGTLSRGARYSRIGEYLASEYEEQANAILDFEYWQNGNTAISAPQAGSPATATVIQRRPRMFDFGVFTGTARPNSDKRAKISATGTVEAHYPDYLQ